MVNIDTVYQKVLAIANKEQRGYITPQEFNLFADYAQKDIFEKYLYDPEYYSIGHNVLGFDIYIHNILRKACGKKSDYSYINRMFDTNCLAKAFKMNLKKPDSNLTLWQSKLNNYRKKGMKTSQGFLLKEFGIEHDPKKLHDAIYDVKMTLEIFHQLTQNQ